MTGIELNLNHLFLQKNRREKAPVTASLITYLSATAFEKSRSEHSTFCNDIEKSFLNTAYILVETLEKRDAYTGGHSRRVKKYCTAVGKILGLSESEMHRLQLAAILHDIGKIGIADDVLLKKGKLTDEEFRKIKKHPEYGAELLKHIEPLKDIIPGVKSHHEHYDGKGYPDGLEGKEIDFIARIITVADAFDAMTTDRPYRQALDIGQAMAELRRKSATQFDPDIVGAFVSAFGENNLSETGDVKIFIDTKRRK